MARGEFRQDLYYRINVVTVELPPLRDRISDIPLLAAHFLDKHAKALAREFVGFTAEAMDLLRRYSYPGNVRELENIVERAAVLSKSPTIGVDAFPEHVVAHGSGVISPRLRLVGDSLAPFAPAGESSWTPTPLEHALREPEKHIILRALKANDWNRQKTAEDLNINRTTLYKKMKQLGIEGEERLAG